VPATGQRPVTGHVLTSSNSYGRVAVGALLLLLLLLVRINAMTSVVVLIAVDPSDLAEAAFNCKYQHLLNTSRILMLKYCKVTS